MVDVQMRAHDIVDIGDGNAGSGKRPHAIDQVSSLLEKASPRMSGRPTASFMV
jgi:hypothetical protein